MCGKNSKIFMTLPLWKKRLATSPYSSLGYKAQNTIFDSHAFFDLKTKHILKLELILRRLVPKRLVKFHWANKQITT